MSDKKFPKIGIGVMIENDEGDVILGLRKGSHGEGEWCFPGGHLDFGETIFEAAKREVKEETGLDVEILGWEEWSQCRRVEESKSQVVDEDLSTFRPFDLFQDCPEEGSMLKTPIAMLLENIPACPERNEPAHQHMDFLFLARPVDEKQEVVLFEEEGAEIRWFTREEIEALDEKTEIFGNVKEYIMHMLS